MTNGGEGIETEIRDHIMVVRINRPEVRNALSPAASTTCAAIFDDFANDSALRVAILTGNGGEFCAGSDLRRHDPGILRPAAGFGGLTERFDLDKPIIAAVNGAALGGGFELALACDLIVAAGSATFGFPEAKLGLAPLAGGPQRLVRAVGEKRALRLLLTAEAIGAEEALSLGFLHSVVPDDTLLDRAMALARTIATLSPAAVRACNQLVTRGAAEPSVAAAMREQAHYPAVRAMIEGDDRKEGVRAFREKRPPNWTS